MSDEVDDFADDDFEDEVAAEGNRIDGARAVAVAEHVTRHLADDPDAIEIEVEQRGGEVALLVHANPDDMGRLIGRRGRVIQALRQLVRAAGSADGVKANVDVVELMGRPLRASSRSAASAVHTASTARSPSPSPATGRSDTKPAPCSAPATAHSWSRRRAPTRVAGCCGSTASTTAPPPRRSAVSCSAPRR
jgi:predicted RNA-binding protein YlqC (UPF0109 family)